MFCLTVIMCVSYNKRENISHDSCPGWFLCHRKMQSDHFIRVFIKSGELHLSGLYGICL